MELIPTGRVTEEDRGRRWIVVADRDGDEARRLASYLFDRRLRAFPTAYGREALHMAATHALSAAVVDMALLDMDGPTLVRRLHEIHPKLPVIMTSADYAPALEVRARQLGIAQYLHKPFSPHRAESVLVRVAATSGAVAV